MELIRFEFRKENGIRCAYKTNRFLRKRRHDDIFMHIKFLNCMCIDASALNFYSYVLHTADFYIFDKNATNDKLISTSMHEAINF